MTDSLRAKIAAGKRVAGTWVSLPDIAVVEILAQAGFDYLLIDGEHAPTPPAALPPLALAAERHGCPIVYRVQANRGDLIKAALDVGVDGLMVPDLPVEECGPLAAECEANFRIGDSVGQSQTRTVPSPPVMAMTRASGETTMRLPPTPVSFIR